MILQAYGAALLIIAASVIVGRAICVAAGGAARWWAAPAVGFAALIVLATAAIKLPGRAVPAVILTLVLLLASVAFLWSRRSWSLSLADLTVAGMSMFAASLPFIANGRVGLQGVSLDDDTANFLLFTEGLRSSRMEHLWGPANGYPLGPPSLAATVASATGMSIDMAFCGLLLAIVVITALVGARLLGERTLWRRVLLGLGCALPYLAAAYYAEGSFKETVMALLLLAFVVHLEQVRHGGEQLSIARCWRLLLPSGLLLAGAVYTYSYVAVVWFAGAVAIWLAAEAAWRPRLLREWLTRRRLAELAPWAGAGIAVMVVLLAPVAAQLRSFFSSVGVSPAGGASIPTDALGNLIHPLSFYEALGVWWGGDFRLAPADGFRAGELSAFALAVLICGLLWSLRRRQLLLPAALAASVLIWWHADRSQSPYVAAKGLVIAAPLVMALGLRALLSGDAADRAMRLLALGVAAAFCAAAAYSSYSALRSEPVDAPQAGQELAAFARRIGDGSVLYLGDDPYAPWELRDASVSALNPGVPSQHDATARASKPVGGQLDFDSVSPSSLNRFGWVITSNTPYASQPPSSFLLVASSRLYELWKRTGPVTPRGALDPSGAPGAVLNCQTPDGRGLSLRPGVAAIMAAPVTIPGTGLVPGGSTTLNLPLPAGTWDLSIQYKSDFTLDLSAQGHHWAMPPSLSLPGQFFAVGRVQSAGIDSPVVLHASTPTPSSITNTDGRLEYASFPTIVATPAPWVRRIVPLRQACGRYVDWYGLL